MAKTHSSKHSVTNSSVAEGKPMVIKQGDVFAVFNSYGNIVPSVKEAQGLYYANTRFLSAMEFSIDDEKPLYLTSALDADNEIMTIDLANPTLYENHKVSQTKGDVHIQVTKFIWEEVCYNRILFHNYGRNNFSFTIKISFDADYKDIFDIRGINPGKRGKLLDPEISEKQILFGYHGLDNIVRRTKIHFDSAPDHIKNKEVFYKVDLDPSEEKILNFNISLELENHKPEVFHFDQALHKVVHKIKIKEGSFTIKTDNEDFNGWLDRSKADMDMMVTSTKYGLYPYAGIPWYSTPFGRDGIITAWEALWIEPEVARGVLHFLAATQAMEENNYYDAEPGKIFHEKREGEMANTKEVPFKMYYGTIDATPLFIGLAGAYYERTGDIDTIKKIWPNIERGLSWIDNYGDLDGDGFIEYETKSGQGLNNQGWKDSEDSVFYANGDLAKPPIALCEVQGYVYYAKMKASMLARKLGHNEKSDELKRQAEILKKKFAKGFWSQDNKTFVIALDGNKNQCDVITSNAGQCLFSGIVEEEQAAKITHLLMTPKMFSGWGVRTVAMGEARFNPMSYHNGSVWPHDNALIAYGLSKYGYTEEAKRIAEGIFAATKYMPQQRLPELFCGFDKKKNQGPVGYPVACSPQAWAVASAYLYIQSFLGLDIDASKKRIELKNAVFPDTINEMMIRNLTVGDSKMTLYISRDENSGRLKVKAENNTENIDIQVCYKDIEGSVEAKERRSRSIIRNRIKE